MINFEDYKFENWQDYRNFAKLIVANWNDTYGHAILHKNILTLITGGWSENEYLESQIRQNKRFYCHCWKKSERGGLTVYELPTKKSFK